MASIATSDASRRGVNHELPLVPFIDFLLCLVAFLLVTAVWTTESRLRADANVPGQNTAPRPTEKPKELHVAVGERDFELVWKQGATVVESERVIRRGVRESDGTVRYPELGAAVERQWKAQGVHRSDTDLSQDRAVLHTGNEVEFAEVVAALDQIMATKRSLRSVSGPIEAPAFAVSFASD